MKYAKFPVLLILVIGFAAACASTPEKRSFGEVVDDTVLTSRVKTKLLADKETKGIKINVDSWKGDVTLKGKVSSEAERAKTVEVVQGVSGVRSVNDLLTVGDEDVRVKAPASSPAAKTSGSVKERDMNAPATSASTAAASPTPAPDTGEDFEDPGETAETGAGTQSEGKTAPSTPSTSDRKSEDTGVWVREPTD